MAKNVLPNQGDIYIKDTGEGIANVDDDDIKFLRPVPVEIDIYIDGFIYTYSLTERREDEEAKEMSFDNL